MPGLPPEHPSQPDETRLSTCETQPPHTSPGPGRTTSPGAPAPRVSTTPRSRDPLTRPNATPTVSGRGSTDPAAPGNTVHVGLVARWGTRSEVGGMRVGVWRGAREPGVTSETEPTCPLETSTSTLVSIPSPPPHPCLTPFISLFCPTHTRPGGTRGSDNLPSRPRSPTPQEDRYPALRP